MTTLSVQEQLDIIYPPTPMKLIARQILADRKAANDA